MASVGEQAECDPEKVREPPGQADGAAELPPAAPAAASTAAPALGPEYADQNAIEYSVPLPRAELGTGITMSLGPPPEADRRRQRLEMEQDDKAEEKEQEEERRAVKIEAGGVAAAGASDRGVAAASFSIPTPVLSGDFRGCPVVSVAGEDPGEVAGAVVEGPLSAVVAAATAAVKRDIPPPPPFEESLATSFLNASSDQIGSRLTVLRDAFKHQRMYFDEYVANCSRRARRQQQQPQQQQQARESEEEPQTAKREPVENDDEVGDPSFRSKRKEKALVRRPVRDERDRPKKRKVSATRTGANGRRGGKVAAEAETARNKRVAASYAFDSSEEPQPRPNRRGARETKRKGAQDPNDYDRDLPRLRGRFEPFLYDCVNCGQVVDVAHYEWTPPRWRTRKAAAYPAYGTYVCYDCAIAMTRRSSCPVCSKQYRKNEPAVAFDNPWIRCDRCHRWIHSKCDDIADIEVYSDANPDHVPYTCPVCRDKERLGRKF